MANLLAKAASPEALNHAWRWLRNARGSWARGVSMDEMRSNVVLHVGRISRDLLSGCYRPDVMRCFSILKGNNEERLICAASTRDRVAQRAVLATLEPLGEKIFLDSSFGFRPHCTVDMALARVRESVRREYVWLVDADIRKCFDSIPHGPVLKKLKKFCGDRNLVRLVGDWLASMPAEAMPDGKMGVGLPQGMVLSPFLCNLYLHEFDVYMARKGVEVVRFADDFVLMCKTEREAARALRLAQRALQRLRLELHPEKTKIIRSSNRHRFLGKRLPDSRPRFVL